MFKIFNISKSYGTKVVFSDVSFGLEKGQRAALVGSNGIGKTTLLRIIAGLEQIDEGKITTAKNLKIGYLPQDTSLTGDETVDEFLKQTKTPAHKIEAMLIGFEMNEVDLKRSLSQLSSGQKSKVALINILLTKPDILLLDEPTNNLDIPALIWLENFLINTEMACLIVSHDRQFLDKVTNQVLEIDRDKKTLIANRGSYSDYLERKKKEREALRKQYVDQQDEIKRLTSEIREKKIRSLKADRMSRPDNDKLLLGFKREQAVRSFANSAKAMEKRLEKMDKVEKLTERAPLSISLEARGNGSPVDIVLNQVVVGYPGRFELGPIDLSIDYGQRVGFLGLNGSGKSALLKTITGYLSPISGQVLIGSGLKIGNMMQEHESLPREETPLSFIKERTGCHDQNAFATLVKFGFSEKDIRGRIAEISPGGRARLLLALFSLLSVNALVLDEPTNHLDIEAVEALEEVLGSYQGTVILVSHDRYFLEKAKIGSAYLLADRQLTRINDLQEYVKIAEEKARKLLRLLKS